MASHVAAAEMCGQADFPTAILIALIVVIPLICSAWALDIARDARRIARRKDEEHR